jgi:hypothetical protein
MDVGCMCKVTSGPSLGTTFGVEKQEVHFVSDVKTPVSVSN